jgi:hypothetical protein
VLVDFKTKESLAILTTREKEREKHAQYTQKRRRSF